MSAARSNLTVRTPPEEISTATTLSTTLNPIRSAAPALADNFDVTPVSSRRPALKRLKADYPNDSGLLEQLFGDISALKMMMMSCEKNIQLLVAENKILKKELVEVKQILSDVDRNSRPDHARETVAKTPVAVSFASVLKMGKPVLIHPKTPSNCDATERVLKEKLNPSDYALKGVKTTKNGGVVVECFSSSDRNKFIANAKEQFGEKYDVTIPTKVCRIRICGLSENPTDANQLKTSLQKQNADIVFDCATLKVVHTFPLKNKLRFGATLEVDSDTSRRLLDAKRVFLGWDSCVVYEDLNIRRCYKCWGFNHIAAKCSATHHSCPKCSGKHTVSECTSAEEKCVVCLEMAATRNLPLDANHAATSLDCPTYRHRADLARTANNYAT